MKDLTEKQKIVLKAMYDNVMFTKGCTAGDFGFVDEVIEDLKDQMTMYQIGAVIATLSKKNLVKVWKRQRVNDISKYKGDLVRQFTFFNLDDVKELVK